MIENLNSGAKTKLGQTKFKNLMFTHKSKVRKNNFCKEVLISLFKLVIIVFTIILCIAIWYSVEIYKMPDLIKQLTGDKMPDGMSRNKDITKFFMNSFPDNEIDLDTLDVFLLSNSFELVGEFEGKRSYKYAYPSIPFCKCSIFITAQEDGGDIKATMFTYSACL